MQNSSKKSWRPSPSQASPPPPPPPKAGPASQPQQKGAQDKDKKAVVKVKPKALTIPVMPGLRLLLEARFFTALFLSFGLYIYAAFMVNEWMYFLASAFLTSLWLGVAIPLLQVMDVKVEASMPEEITVQENAELKVHLIRTSRLGPISMLIPLKCLRITVNLVRRAGSDKNLEQVLPPEPLLIDELQHEAWLNFPTPNLRRGIYFLQGIELVSCFPFGLAWWSRTLKIATDKRGNNLSITVHPRNVPVSGNFLHQLKGMTSSMGLSSSSSVVVTQSNSVRGVREFRVGDSIRHIHWPSSARLNKLLVREFDSETLPVFDLMLDLRAPWKNQDQFELAVCLIHSLAHLGYKLGTIPELTLNPQIGSKMLNKGLLSDLPALPPGLQLLSEILARVEPISMTAAEEKEEQEQQEEEGERHRGIADRPLLTIIPSQEVIMKYLPGIGDTLCSPIELVTVPRNWYEEEEPPATDAKVQFKAARGKTASKYKRTLGRPTDTTVIATLTSEGDLEPL